MFTSPFNKPQTNDLDSVIERLLKMLDDMDPRDDDYDKVTEQIVKLRKLRSEENSKKRLSPDVLASAATNLAGILLIINFEHAHVLGTKALGLVKNMR